MEHLRHFGLSEDPFRNDHLERFLHESPPQLDAQRRLERAVRQGRGFALLTGPVGSGKTTVARALFESLEEEAFEARMMVVLRANADFRWLLGRIAAELGVEEPASEREALLLQVYEKLAIVREDGRHAVVIVDEAQALAKGSALEEVSALVKLEYDERRLLSVVLVGTPALDAAITGDPQLAHHLDARVALRAHDAEEAGAYLSHRLRSAGGELELLLPGAVAALQQLGGGWPGRMNTLADNALYEAYLAGRTQVTRGEVERAAAALGWSETPAAPEKPAPAPAPRASAPAARSIAETTNPDLDAELEASFEPAPQRPMRRPVPERAAAGRTTVFSSERGGPRPPPKLEDAVDELFTELIEEE
ncbi:MAG TPA: AAA family ATPase [Myxococcota bacterium]|nr:AAA family ATPase [Myxococcota bacterium]